MRIKQPIFVMFSNKAWYGHDSYQLDIPISHPTEDGQSTTGFDDVSHDVSLGKQ
ncbi:hypothetical protein [Photorhabdus aegyptia]|uniref:hypothetical protein n=1 Tax=Photorhabdus aegyptia TaxID=2805098 RepID=UPI001E29F94E|nr:hypothetical protein [Photorhabdus aegyptia]MCC8459444.1 hypothetical protein [Photorhabdus aegyptia]